VKHFYNKNVSQDPRYSRHQHVDLWRRSSLKSKGLFTLSVVRRCGAVRSEALTVCAPPHR